MLAEEDSEIATQIIVPSLFAPFYRLLNNAGHSNEEIEDILEKMIEDKSVVYDVENGVMGDPKKLGIFDATSAVEQALLNAVSISSVMGTLGGIVCFPRSNQLEMQEARDQLNFDRTLDNAEDIRNEANERS